MDATQSADWTTTKTWSRWRNSDRRLVAPRRGRFGTHDNRPPPGSAEATDRRAIATKQERIDGNGLNGVGYLCRRDMKPLSWHWIATAMGYLAKENEMAESVVAAGFAGESVDLGQSADN